MVYKKDKKKKAKKTPNQKQKQKQKQSVIVNVNITKPATRRRTLVKKTHDNRPLPPTPPAYGIPVQQSVQPSLNNITEYLKQKEGQENNRHVNLMSAMRAIQRDEGTQGTVTQADRGAGTSTQAPAAKPAVAKSTPPKSILDFFGGGGLPDRLRPPPPKRTKSEGQITIKRLIKKPQLYNRPNPLQGSPAAEAAAEGEQGFPITFS